MAWTAATRTVGKSVTAGADRMPAPRCPSRSPRSRPYPWEQHHEVNRFVERLSDELCRRGHRVVVVAPSDSRELVREGRAKVKALQLGPRRAVRRAGLRVGARRRAGAAVPARRLGVAAARRVAHARGPARARRARLRARARAVRAERVLGGAAPLARAERGHLPRGHRALRLDAGGAPGGGAAVRPPRRPHRELRRHARPDRALLPRRLPGDPARRRPAPRARRNGGGPPEIVFSAEEERGALRLFLRALRRLPTRARLARHDLAARPRRGAGGLAAAAAARPRDASPGPADGSEAQHLARADDRGGRLGGHRARRRSSCCARSPAARCPWSRACRSTRRRVRDGELGLLFEPRDAVTLAAQLERLLDDPALVADVRAARSRAAHPRLEWSRAADEFEELYERIAARRHAPNGRRERAQAAPRARLHPRRPAHAHRPLARLRDAGGHAARHGEAGRPRGDRRSPTTTRCRARSRRASAPTGSR